jgi:hypothetical protein
MRDLLNCKTCYKNSISKDMIEITSGENKISIEKPFILCKYCSDTLSNVSSETLIKSIVHKGIDVHIFKSNFEYYIDIANTRLYGSFKSMKEVSNAIEIWMEAPLTFQGLPMYVK